jgi:hypothetical protein
MPVRLGSLLVSAFVVLAAVKGISSGMGAGGGRRPEGMYGSLLARPRVVGLHGPGDRQASAPGGVPLVLNKGRSWFRARINWSCCATCGESGG